MFAKRIAITMFCAGAPIFGAFAPVASQEVIEIQPIPRSERPLLSVSEFAFTASPGKDDLEELNSIGGALFALRGGDVRERQKETLENLGKAASAMLIERLINTGQFRIVERAMLDEIRREQAVNDSMPQPTGFTGAAYVVTGQITKFAKSKKKKGGLFGAIAGAAGVGGLAQEETAYEVGITVRIVDSQYGEVLASMSTEGVTVGDKKFTIAGGGGALGGAIAGGLGSNTSDEREKRIAESLGAAVDALLIQFVTARENGVIVP